MNTVNNPDKDWEEYESELKEMSLSELFEELQYILNVGEAKMKGKTLYSIDQQYLM